MTDGKKRSFKELRTNLLPLFDYTGRKIHHIKSGGLYQIVGFHYREADMSIEFTYMPLGAEPVLFSRPVGELFDGRFEFIEPESSP